MTPIFLLVGAARSGKDTAGAVIARLLGGTCIALADPIKRYLMDKEYGFGLTEAQLWGDEKEKSFERRVVAPGSLLGLAEDHWGVADEEVLEALGGALDEWNTKLPKVTTPRHMMQSLGTDVVRETLDPNFWIDYGLEVADALLEEGGTYDRKLGIVESDTRPGAVVITDGRFHNEVLPVLKCNGRVLLVERSGAESVIAAAAQKHASETQQKLIPRHWYDGRLANVQATAAQFEMYVENYVRGYVPGVPV